MRQKYVIEMNNNAYLRMKNDEILLRGIGHIAAANLLQDVSEN